MEYWNVGILECRGFLEFPLLHHSRVLSTQAADISLADFGTLGAILNTSEAGVKQGIIK